MPTTDGALICAAGMSGGTDVLPTETCADMDTGVVTVAGVSSCGNDGGA